VGYQKNVCEDLSGVPPAYMAWYQAMFERGQRVPPPVGGATTVYTPVAVLVTGHKLSVRELYSMPGLLRATYLDGRQFLVAKDKVSIDQKEVHLPAEKAQFCLSGGRYQIPVAAWTHGPHLKLYNLYRQEEVPVQLHVEQVMAVDGRLYVQNGENLLEILLQETGINTVLPVYHQVGVVSQYATRFYDGLAVQQLFGNTFLSVFPQTRQHVQVPVPSLQGHKVVNARYQDRVCVIITHDQNKYHRHVLRFSKDFRSNDIRTVQDVDVQVLNFTVLDNGVCLLLNEEGKLEMFRNDPNSAGVQLLEDPALSAGVVLTSSGSEAQFVHGDKLYAMTMRP